MSRALLAFRPEAYGSDGDILLFGVSISRPVRSRGPSPIEQLSLANHFLESQSAPAMAALLEYIIRRASASYGWPIQPQVAASLLPRLMRAAAVVRDALRSSDARQYPFSPEGIFGTELEGLSPEDQEFESARRFVQFVDELARIAALAAPTVPQHLLASYAEREAARHLAPGLARVLGPSPNAAAAARAGFMSATISQEEPSHA
jgi:hypothetical protein